MIIDLISVKKRNGIFLIALDELRNYLQKLFGADARDLADADEQDSGCRIYLYDIQSMPPMIDETFVGDMPALSDQGFMIRKLDDRSLLIAGGSDAAILWAVYELAEAWGVVHTLHEDVYPVERTAALLPDIDKVYEPRQRIRAWRIMNIFLHGPEGWSLAQHRKFITQLARQKFNGVLLCIWPQHPFINYDIDGISKKKAHIHFGMEFHVSDRSIGKEHLGPSGLYTNPEFRNCRTFEEMYETGVRYIKEIIGFARSYGMRIEMSVNIFDLPREYSSLLEKPADVYQAGMLTVSESGDIFGTNHIRILNRVFESYMETYPDVDVVQFQMPEHARNVLSFAEAWESVRKRSGLTGKYDIEKMLTDPLTNSLAAGGASRAENEGRMSIVLVDALRRIFETTGIDRYARSTGKKLSVCTGLSCPALLPVISESLWDDAYLKIQFGYASSRAVRSLRLLDRLNTEKVNVEQVITLQDDNIGYLPQFSTRSIKRLLDYSFEHDWNGYSTRFWPIGDLDPMAHYMAKASWEKTGVQDAYRAHITGIYGKDLEEPVDTLFNLLEDATVIMDLCHLSFIFPVNNNMSGRIGPEKVNLMDDSLWHVRAVYSEVLHICGKLLDKGISGKARENVSYWAAKAGFGMNVINGVYFLESGNKELGCNNIEQAVIHYGDAMNCFEQGLKALAENVRDESDIGALAIYNQLLLNETAGKIRELTGRKEFYI